MSQQRPVFLEMECQPPGNTVPGIIQPPIRVLIPLFASPVVWFNASDTGRTELVLANGTAMKSSEKFVDLRTRLSRHAEVVTKGLEQEN